MTQQHPIAPPPDKIHNWLQLEKIGWSIEQIITLAAQWGADTELKACCEWLHVPNNRSDRGDGWLMPGRLRAARRPKPLSLKEQALEVMREIQIEPCIINGVDTNAAVRAKYDTIRRALEQLPNQTSDSD